MKIFFSILVVLFLFGLSRYSFANSKTPDIRYTALIYFFSDNDESIRHHDLSSFFQTFRKVDSFPDKTETPVFSYSFVDVSGEDYAVPDIESLSSVGRGLYPHDAVLIQITKFALLVEFSCPASKSLECLKTSGAGLYSIATKYNGLIWDSETRLLFTPEKWKEERIDLWDGDTPSVEFQICIHFYHTGEAVRAITLGMAKFGLPDIVVNNISWSQKSSITNLINLTAQAMVEGLTRTPDGIIKLDIDRLKDTAYKRDLIPTLFENAQKKMNVSTKKGTWEEGDPDNEIIELLFDNAQGKSLREKQDYLVSNIFGWKDDLVYAKHDELIEEASQKAKEKLDSLRQDFNAGLAPGEFIQLKAPFDTSDGGTEWMWLEVLSWEGKTIRGILSNEPFDVPELKAGSEVTVNQDDVFDYLRTSADGTTEGNETGPLILKYQE